MKPDLEKIKNLLLKGVKREKMAVQLGYNSVNSLSKVISKYKLNQPNTVVEATKSVTTPQRLGVLRNQWKTAIAAESKAGVKASITKQFEKDCGVNFAKEAKELKRAEKLEAREAKRIAKKKEKKDKPMPFKIIDYVTITQRNRDLTAENIKLKRKLAA